MAINNPYVPGDPYSYDLKWIVDKLRSIDSQLAAAVETYGSPLTVRSASEMKLSDRIYIYLGSEAGYIKGNWYYYDKDTNLWTSGGAYGGYPVDDALSSSSRNAVENSVITAKIAEIDSDISELQQSASSANPYKKVLFIGDSYAVGNHLTNPSNSWPHIVGGLGLGLSLNESYFVEAVGGYGIMKEQGYRFSELLINFINTHPASVRQSITHIVMAGGANDWINNVTSLIEQASSIQIMAQTYMPQAVIIFMPIGWAIHSQWRFGMANAYHNMELYLPQYGIKVLNGCFKTLQNNTLFVSDGVHPNDLGNTALSSAIISALFGGISRKTLSHSFAVNGTTLGYVNESDFSYTLVLPPLNTYLSPLEGTRTDWWDCGAISCNVVLGTLDGYVPRPRFTLPIIYENESAARRMYITEFDIHKTSELGTPHLYARILYPDPASGSYMFPASGSTMYFMGGSVPLPIPGL